MKNHSLPLALILLLLSQVVSATDWRQTAKTNEKINNLIQVMPGASNVMLQMGERYRNLYCAAKQEKWEFAEYQVEEMQDLIQTLIITRPKRSKTATKFLQSAFKHYPVAFKKRDWLHFKNAFEKMRQQCMTCHVDNDHAFVTLPKHPRIGNSPVLDTK